jgi:hypothetical protein
MILSKDNTFTPQTAIPGFATIVPGLNLISASTLTGAQFTGATTGASTLGGFTASQFLRSDISQTTNYAFGAAGGLTVGSDLVFDASSGAVAVISETTLNKNIRFDINQNGVTAQALLLTASTNSATFGNNVTVSGRLSVTGATTLTGAVAVTGITTVSNKILPNANNTIDIGASGTTFATIYAKATSAQYADLAERFEADNVYLPGTVVELGGAKEITRAVQDLSESVFGVISTAAAYLMNAGAGSDARVPVRVTGTVKKGDRLVSAGAGLARAASRTEITAFNVIGRSLEDKTTQDEGVVEAIVKLNS